MDDDTRYWIATDPAGDRLHHDADPLLRDTKPHMGKIPSAFITERFQAYKKGVWQEDLPQM